MLPYFTYTEDVQTFCNLVGFNIDNRAYLTRYVCTYPLKDFPTLYITPFNLDPNTNPYIPSEKVLEYLTLMLNGYSCKEAINEIGVVWG